MVWDKYIIERSEQPLSKKDLALGLFEVLEVYQGSPAYEAGVRKGMLYIPENKYAFEEYSIRERYRYEQQKLRFIDTENEILLEFHVYGFLYGIKVRRSVQTLCNDLAYLDFWTDDLFNHILEDRPDALESISYALEHPGFSFLFSDITRSLALVNDSPEYKTEYLIDAIGAVFFGIRHIWQQVLRLYKKPAFLRPSFLGIISALYYAKTGELEKARSFVHRFESDDNTYATSINAIYYYVKSLVAELEEENEDEIHYWLSLALDASPHSNLIRNKIVSLSGQDLDDLVPPTTKQMPVPLSYVLLEWDPLTPRPETGRLVSMNAALSKLEEDQFLILISLASYRGNIYYSRAMYRIGMIHSLLNRHFPRVHIVTAYEPNISPPEDELFAGESYALRQGVKLQIMYDPEYFIPDLLESASSPAGAIINKQGNIVYKGSFKDEEGFWNAIATLKQPQKDKDTTKTEHPEGLIA